MNPWEDARVGIKNDYGGTKINREGFGEFLKGRELTEGEIEQSFAIVEDYETFLRISEQDKTLRSSTTSRTIS